VSERQKVTIIGSGPAGYTAALYAARANLAPLMFAGANPGGQLMITTDVENYPGFPKGILGPELMELFRAQAARFGTEIVDADVTAVDFSKRPFRVVSDGREIESDTVIVSTGATAKWLDVPGERELMGHGVSGCATCDGFFFKGRELVVVGGGDTAMEEATFLTKFASKVTVVHRRGELRASKIMQDKAKHNPKIAWVWHSAVERINGTREGGIASVTLKNLQTGAASDFATQGVFVAIGHEPNTKLFRGQLELNEVGYIKTAAPSSRTSVPGVFAAGDVQDPTYRQAVSAAGTGCVAAIDAERFLSHG
jgi:thioredoxin reductase (NADPH)